VREGAVELTRPCHCGNYDPVRPERLLQRLLPYRTINFAGPIRIRRTCDCGAFLIRFSKTREVEGRFTSAASRWFARKPE
jgi:hypothetical protein